MVASSEHSLWETTCRKPDVLTSTPLNSVESAGAWCWTKSDQQNLIGWLDFNWLIANTYHQKIYIFLFISYHLYCYKILSVVLAGLFFSVHNAAQMYKCMVAFKPSTLLSVLFFVVRLFESSKFPLGLCLHLHCRNVKYAWMSFLKKSVLYFVWILSLCSPNTQDFCFLV